MNVIENQAQATAMFDQEGNLNLYGDHEVDCELMVPGNLNVVGSFRSSKGISVNGRTVVHGNIHLRRTSSLGGGIIYGDFGIIGDLSSTSELEVRGITEVSGNLSAISAIFDFVNCSKTVYLERGGKFSGGLKTARLLSNGDVTCIKHLTCTKKINVTKTLSLYGDLSTEEVDGQDFSINHLKWPFPGPPTIPDGGHIGSVSTIGSKKNIGATENEH